jgi:hypothetical protein
VEVEEFQTGNEGFEGSFGDTQLIADVEKVLFNVVFAEAIGGNHVVGSELANGPDIQLLGALAEASEMQIADQTVSELGHGDSPGWGRGNPAPTAGKRKPSTRRNVARSAPQNPHHPHDLNRPPAAKPLRPKFPARGPSHGKVARLLALGIVSD